MKRLIRKANATEGEITGYTLQGGVPVFEYEVKVSDMQWDYPMAKKAAIKWAQEHWQSDPQLEEALKKVIESQMAQIEEQADLFDYEVPTEFNRMLKEINPEVKLTGAALKGTWEK